MFFWWWLILLPKDGSNWQLPSAATLLWGGFILLGGWVALAMCAIAICRDITSSIINAHRSEKEQMKITKSDWLFLALWSGAFTIATIFTSSGFLTLFAYFATMTFTVSIWQKNPLVYRILGIFVGVFWITYNIALSSLMGVILESSLLIFVIAGLIMFVRKTKNNKLSSSSPTAE